MGVIYIRDEAGQWIPVSGAKGASGDPGPRGEKGEPGPAPVRGVDYWTDADQADFLKQVNEYVANELTKKSQVRPDFANSVAECTDTTKLYVLPDGYLYAYMLGMSGVPEISYEGEAGGFWYADEWNPSGAWQVNNACSAKRTNVFAVQPGDTLFYRGNGTATVQSVAWMDSNQNYLAEEYYAATSGAVTVTVPEGAAYAWFSSFGYVSGPDAVVLDVRWENCQSAEQMYRWVSTGHAFVAGGYTEDVLKGKKIVYDGDSICESDSDSGGAYPGLIAQLTGGTYENHAVGGGRLCAHSERHSVVNNLENLPADGDLYCFEGGINDFWGNTPIGTWTAGDYTGAVDPETICGAMETIFRYALQTFVGKPVCFVIVHKIQNTGHTANGNGNTFREYRDAMVQICEKYSIPYYDAFLESGLNGWNEAQNQAFLKANSAGTADGIHPTADGYRRYYVPQLLALFRRIMPVL